MADDASRLVHLSDSDFLTHMNRSYPQPTGPWRLRQLSSSMVTLTTSALRKKPLTMPSQVAPTRSKPTPLNIGKHSVTPVVSSVTSSDYQPYRSPDLWYWCHGIAPCKRPWPCGCRGGRLRYFPARIVGRDRARRYRSVLRIPLAGLP